MVKNWDRDLDRQVFARVSGSEGKVGEMQQPTFLAPWTS